MLFCRYTDIPVYAKSQKIDRGDFMPKPQAMDALAPDFAGEFYPDIATSWHRSQQAELTLTASPVGTFPGQAHSFSHTPNFRI